MAGGRAEKGYADAGPLHINPSGCLMKRNRNDPLYIITALHKSGSRKRSGNGGADYDLKIIDPCRWVGGARVSRCSCGF